MALAVHEFGHSLGLDHSGVSNSVMSPYFNGFRRDFRLTEDDIKGIQSMYGKPINA